MFPAQELIMTNTHRIQVICHRNQENGMNKGLKLSAIPLFLSACGGRTTTCIVITPPGTSPTGTRDSASVRLFSNILPALISFKSLTVFGAISLSVSKNRNSKFHSASKNDRHGLQNREFAWEKFQCVGQYDNTVSFQHNQPRVSETENTICYCTIPSLNFEMQTEKLMKRAE